MRMDVLSTNRFRPDGLKEKGEMDKEGLCNSIVPTERLNDLRLDGERKEKRSVKKALLFERSEFRAFS